MSKFKPPPEAPLWQTDPDDDHIHDDDHDRHHYDGYLVERRVRERSTALEAAKLEHKQAEQAKRLLQKQLAERERLAAIGGIVATFAHEVGNPLNSMYLQAQMLDRLLAKDGVALDAPRRNPLRLIMGEMARLANLLAEFRTLARRHDRELTATPLAALVAEALRLQAPAFTAHHVTPVQELECSPVVLADRDKLTQALVNLCKNALEAMPEGGTLTVSLVVTEGEARLRVRDTGTGIPDEVDIFEPFITTKDTGTGLGLPVVRRIVDIHAGRLSYESELGVGTTFEIALPLAPPAHAHS